MTDNAPHMEARVTALESSFTDLRKEVSGLKETINTALLGSLDGKPGMMQTLTSSLEASRINSTKLDLLTRQIELHGEQLEGLRLDKAKVTGVVITCSVLWAALTTIVGLIVKMWK